MVSQDPHVKLRQLAEKQMKSCLHAQFLKDCLSENVIPKGLRLKLKVNTGSDSDELQSSIDGLLRRVSSEICEQIRDEHLRKSESYGKEMENVRNAMMKTMNPEVMFATDEMIAKHTDEKKEVMKNGHRKKLAFLKGENQANNSETIIITDTPVKQVKSSKKATEQRRNNRNNKASKTLNKKLPYQNKSSVTNKIPEKVEPSKGEAVNQSKNLETPGTSMTYAEALKKGENQVQRNLQSSVETLTKIMTQFITIMMDSKQDEPDDLYAWKTPKHGAKQRKGLNRYRKEKRQS